MDGYRHNGLPLTNFGAASHSNEDQEDFFTQIPDNSYATLFAFERVDGEDQVREIRSAIRREHGELGMQIFQHRLEGRGYKEIAAKTGLTFNQIHKTWLPRIRRTLRGFGVDKLV